MLWLAGAFFLILRKLSERIAHRNRFLKFVPFVFLALAVSALAYAPLPFIGGSLASWAAALVAWILGGIGALIGVSPTVIAGVALVGVLLFGLADLIVDQKPDGMAKAMVFALPVLALVAGGSIAAQVQEVISTLGGVGPEFVVSVTD